VRSRSQQEEARALREIKEKLAREKAAKLAARQPAATAAAASAPAPAAAAPAAVAASSASTATEAVVQVRFPDGKTLQNSFKPDDSLRVVHSWVQSSRYVNRALPPSGAWGQVLISRRRGGGAGLTGDRLL
jgi:hypothetical protein